MIFFGWWLRVWGIVLIGLSAILSLSRHGQPEPFYDVGVVIEKGYKYMDLIRLFDGYRTRILSEPGDYTSPTLSADSQWVAFVNYNLYRVRLNGSELQALTTTFDGAPTWSPDAQWIAFTSYREGNWDIYRVNVQTGHEERLTDDPADDTQPVWSPDGQWIAFLSARSGHWNVFRMKPDGSEEMNLTPADQDVFNPIWSPDSQYLGFYYNSISIKRITHRMRPDGTHWELLRYDLGAEWLRARLPVIVKTWHGEWMIGLGMGMVLLPWIVRAKSKAH